MNGKPGRKSQETKQIVTQFEMDFVEAPSKARFDTKLQCRMDYQLIREASTPNLPSNAS